MKNMSPAPSATRALSPFVWLVLCLVSTIGFQLKGTAATIDLANAIIVKPAGTPPKVVEYAAAELQTHLQLLNGGTPIAITTGTQAGKFPIYVGIRPASDTNLTYAAEEARWAITNDGLWLYGNDKDVSGPDTIAVALDSDARTGTLFAVYEFLENHAGISWAEPGDDGIVFTPKTTLSPANGTGSWSPQLVQRKIRLGYSDSFRTDTLLADGAIPPAMRFSDVEFSARQLDERVWMRRMRMGSSAHLSYGHAFTGWWDKYGTTHPEYFALNKNGVRAPVSGEKTRIKLCVSNPAVAAQVAHDHFYRDDGTLKSINSIGYNVNAIENDSRNFCTCDDCKALDVVLPGEENLAVDDRVVTDRYVYFVNKVLEEARKIYVDHYAADYGSDPNPGARIKVLFYAYSRYNFPPRRERLADGIFLFLVPNLGTPLTELDQYFADWKTQGAGEFFHRPNDLNQDTGLPIGFEYHMFEKYRLGNSRLSLKGTDYDMCWNLWPVSGITYYIMARAMYRPEKTFSYWENEYFSTYGAASADIREYHTYWRQLWNRRIMDNREKIDVMSAGKLDLLRAKVTHLTDLLYSENDYDLTDAMLARALTRAGLGAQQRARIQNLQLANQHNRLKYRAVRDNCLASPTTDAAQKRASSQSLLDFRIANKSNLNIHWEALIYLENVYEDNAGTKRLLGTEEPARKTWREQCDAQAVISRQITSFAARPSITAISPADVVAGDTITITGADLYDIDDVKIGGISAASWTRIDAATITAVVPASVPASGSVTVITRGDSATSPAKYYIISPVTAVRQLSGQTVVTGHNLTLTADSDAHPAPVCTWEISTDSGASWSVVASAGKYTISADTTVLKITGIDETMADTRFRYTAANPQTAIPVTSNAATISVQPDSRYPHPVALAIDASSNIYIADNALRTVQSLSPDGALAAFAGSTGVSGTANGVGSAAHFVSPVSLAIAPGNQVLIGDNEANSLRLATAAAMVSTLATNLTPAAIATDTSGNTYIADSSANCIRMVTLSGVVTTIAGSPSGQSGNIDATGTAARFNKPAGIAISPSGTLYVADTGNNIIRAISPGDRAITTITNSDALNSPRGLAIKNTVLYIADTGNSLIRKLDLASATMTTIAGRPGPQPTHGYQAGTGTHAIFDRPQGLALDAAGILYVADTGNAALRKIAADGTVTTLFPAITNSGSTGGGNGNNNSSSGKGGGALSPLSLLSLLILMLLRRGNAKERRK